MVELLRRRGIADERVLAVFAEAPREDFVVSDTPYADMPLPIGCGQTISQPFVVALTLQALQLRGDELALDVGTGSGYSAALLAKLVRRVVTVERVEALARSAAVVLQRYANVEVHCADGTLGWPDAAPFDAIAVAASGPAPPPSLMKQLAIGGRMVLPFGDDKEQRLVRVTRVSDVEFDHRDLGPVRYVPLIGREGWPG
jgi:protein-L-isoaspartate(D-aspartate) O-methyltransferase